MYEFDAPQYKDLSLGIDDSDGADMFFDVETEEPQVENKEMMPVEDVSIKKVKLELDALDDRVFLKAVRRVSSGLPIVKEEMMEDKENMREEDKHVHFEDILQKDKIKIEHTMILRSSKKQPRLNLKTQQKEQKERAAEKISHKRKSLFTTSGAAPKYVAMAEQIYHLHNDTPPRFRSSKHADNKNKKQKPNNTIPKTPKLLTAKRTRPATVVSHDELEEMEVEDMKKHQVSALPLNVDIFQPPRLPPKVEKAPTVPEPFALSQVYKRPAAIPTEEPYKFSARPVPKVVLEGPVNLGQRQQIPVTVPKSPAITKPTRFHRPVRVAALTIDNKMQLENVSRSCGVPVKRDAGAKTTKVTPFSFEARTKKMLENKERKIKEVLEAEKKAREFKANPAPVFDCPKEIIRPARISSMNASKISVTDSEEESHPFKARSPKVLRKPAFQPILEHTHSEPADIQLHTEQRAMERREFENKQLEKMEQIILIKEEMALDAKLREEEEVAKMRREMVHKAKPMPQFKSPPKPSGSLVPLTDPKSPHFTKRVRKHKH